MSRSRAGFGGECDTCRLSSNNNNFNGGFQVSIGVAIGHALGSAVSGIWRR
jgi:hypothetical protein